MSFQARFIDGPRTHEVSAASEGEAGRRCGLHFNPSGDDDINALKGFAAAAMQAVIRARDMELWRFHRQENPSPAERAAHQDALRCFATACTQIEGGQMFAVKGIAATLPRD